MSKKTQRGMIAVLVGMMMGPGALASPAPGVAPKEAKAPAGELLELKPGATKILELPGVSRVAVGDPSIADVSVLGSSRLEVKGISVGKTTVIVWTKGSEKRSYEVHVLK